MTMIVDKDDVMNGILIDAIIDDNISTKSIPLIERCIKNAHSGHDLMYLIYRSHRSIYVDL